ncbi:MAG: hypothetical protein LBC68_12845, partial [Prevotellaceae bacterium]|nr:hypothetical protein [Prevotellaceae bacterium]
KKLLYLMTFALLITACSKDEVSINTNPKAIVGNWELEYFYRGERVDDSNQQIDIDNAERYTKIDAQYSHTLVFTDLSECGLTQRYTDTDYSIHTYKVNGDNIDISEPCEKNISNTDVLMFHLTLGYPIKYKFKNGKLILGSLIDLYAGHTYNVAIYGFYKRKL